MDTLIQIDALTQNERYIFFKLSIVKMYDKKIDSFLFIHLKLKNNFFSINHYAYEILYSFVFVGNGNTLLYSDGTQMHSSNSRNIKKIYLEVSVW